jgi:hypothetical protein
MGQLWLYLHDHSATQIDVSGQNKAAATGWQELKFREAEGERDLGSAAIPGY